ncbi:MAG: MmgE/PrpD family protein [Lachnospiraceae bacterium]|nr:MmgE/PrpD family protein [Lachnospiraceae bacterium]
MGLSSDIARELSEIDNLGAQDIDQLKKLIIDFFAAAYAGYKENKEFNKSVEKVILYQDGIGESTVLFHGKKYPARIAAFMNSVFGHGAELDDGNKKAAGHAGVHIIPAVFALAEKIHSTNNDVLNALATGYEAFIRLSSAVQPGIVKRGFHSTGMAGTLACAAACARLYHLNAQGIEDSIGLATTMTGGLLSYGDSRPYIKPLNPGKAAENGLLAAMLANEGVQGPIESLEGPNGWFHAVTDIVDERYLKSSNHLLVHDCYFKLYPSCRHTHCGIDAAIALNHKIHNRQIKKVMVYIYPNAIKLAGIRLPKNQDETKFSIQYTLACAILKGKYGIEDMDVSKISTDIVELIDKTILFPDETMESRDKGIRGAKVKVVLADGEILEEEVMVPKGDPENPLTKDDIVEKLSICAKGQNAHDDIMKIVSAIEHIDGNGNFYNPMQLTGEINE